MPLAQGWQSSFVVLALARNVFCIGIAPAFALVHGIHSPSALEDRTKLSSRAPFSGWPFVSGAGDKLSVADDDSALDAVKFAAAAAAALAKRVNHQTVDQDQVFAAEPEASLLKQPGSRDTANVDAHALDASLDVRAASAWETGEGAVDTKTLAQAQEQRPQRILIVCLQSSGCTLFAKLLGQLEDTVAFMDTYIYVPPWNMPKPESLDLQGAKRVILKATLVDREIMEPMDRLQQIKAQFRPDNTILFVRDPKEILMHLRWHSGPKVDMECAAKPLPGWGYGNRCGSPEGKLRALESLWEQREEIFDAVVPYEVLVGKSGSWDDVIRTMNAIGLPLERSHFAMEKSNFAIEQYARARMGKSTFDWGVGDVVDGPIRTGSAVEAAAQLVSEKQSLDEKLTDLNAICPKLVQHTDSFRAVTLQAPQSLDSEEVAWFKARASASGQITLLFANSDYADTLLNWFGVGKGSGAVGDNYAIVCLDDAMEALLRAHGKDCFPGRPRYFKRLDGSLYALGPLWMLRVRIVDALLGNGIDVILTDSDALWLKDPLPTLTQVASSSGADIISSRGRGPEHAAKAWGATACMGFIYIRSTAPARLFVKKMLNFAKKSMVFDDQILLNSVLLNAGLNFGKKLAFEQSVDTDVGVTSQGLLHTGGTDVVTVALLPHEKYMRICSESALANAVVAHCLSDNKYGSTGQAKRHELALNGLWVIPERWPAVSSGSFDSWVATLARNATA